METINVKHCLVKQLENKKNVDILYSLLFGQGSTITTLDECEVLFWIEEEKVVSMLLIDFNYPTTLLEYQGVFDKTAEKKILFHSVGTSESFRNRGYSSAILKCAIEFVKHSSRQTEEEKKKIEDGRKDIFLEVLKENIAAINLYTKIGFKIVYSEKTENPVFTICDGKTYYLMRFEFS
jgi:ribosomal protein S18 acetylase RimI-like enzyme